MTTPLPLFNLTTDIGENRRVLCIAAHPDDLEYGTSCAVAEWTDAGHEVTYLLVTSGEAGIAGQDPEVTAPARREEQIRAANAVGVSDVQFLAHPDGELTASLDLRRDIARVIRQVRPHVVLTQTWEVAVEWGVNHVDHRVAGLAAVDATRDAANQWVFRDLDEQGLQPWQADSVLVAGYSGASHRIRVSDSSLHRGIQSLAAHETYLAALPDHPSPEEVMPEFLADASSDDISYAVTILVTG